MNEAGSRAVLQTLEIDSSYPISTERTTPQREAFTNRVAAMA